MIIDFLNKLDKLFESTVDFSRGELCPEIWEKTGDSYNIRKDVEDKIYEILSQYSGYYDLRDMAKEIHVVGSIGTNLYADDADLDVHLIMKEEMPEEERNKIYKFFENKNFIGSHPVNVYIQSNPNQELVGDALYDLGSHTWISGPLIAPDDYNPYEAFKDVISNMPDTLENTDLLMAELKRDVIDAEGIKEALKKLPKEAKEKIKAALEAKLSEIKDDIAGLYDERKNLADIRKQSSAPSSPEEAEEIKKSGEWANNNAMFKFISKYGYLKVIKELEKFIEDDKVTSEEVPQIQKTLKGEVYAKR